MKPLYNDLCGLKEAVMAREKTVVSKNKIGKPIEKSITEQMRNPEYRKNYMLYHVKASLAALIKLLREMNHLTQKELAEKAGLPQSQIARLESLEDERIPGLEQLVRILSALKSRAFLDVVPAANTHSEKREIVLV